MSNIPNSIEFSTTAVSSSGELTPPADQDRARMFPCDQCGADLEFHIDDQQLTCPYCGHNQDIVAKENRAVSENDLRQTLTDLAAKRSDAAQANHAVHEISCGNCAAKVQFEGTLTSTECAYCGTPLQLENAYEAKDLLPVDGVLPFAVNRDTATTNLTAWVKSRWFAPNEFTRRGVQGKFNGIYIPYWTFDSMTKTNYAGLRGVYYTVSTGSGKKRRTVRKIRWSPVSGTFRRFFDDVLVVASKGLPEKRINDLEPWPLRKCRPFSREFLAGFLARRYDIGLHDGFFAARSRVDAAINAEVRRRIGGDVQRVTNIDTTYSALTYKHLLLPLWMLAYRFRNKAYQVVINAATGEVQGDRPYSWIKITLAAIAAAAVVAVAAYVFSEHWS